MIIQEVSLFGSGTSRRYPRFIVQKMVRLRFGASGCLETAIKYLIDSRRLAVPREEADCEHGSHGASENTHCAPPCPINGCKKPLFALAEQSSSSALSSRPFMSHGRISLVLTGCWLSKGKKRAREDEGKGKDDNSRIGP